MSEEPKQENKPITLKKVKFLVGALVYLKTDPEQFKRVVTSVHLTSSGYMYQLRLSTDEPTLHYEVEISEERDDDLADSMYRSSFGDSED